MAGILHTMNTARQGLAAQQLGLSVTGHNIANVNNADFSRQSVNHAASTPIGQSGFLIGTGVTSQEIRQSADQILENRITSQQSEFSASEAFMTYMQTLGNIFNESSETSMSTVLPEFWDSWNALSNNPGGSAERMNVYENGIKLSERFNTMDADLWNLEQDLNRDIQKTVEQVNRITSEIVELNQAIMGHETSQTSNDNRDLRNSLLKELSEKIDIKTFEGANGDLTVATSGGFSLVSGVTAYELKFNDQQVEWESSSGGYVDITNFIQGGSLGGFLEMRDVELPGYRQEMDALARETIWNTNRLYSQGASEYIHGSVDGSYVPQKSNWLDTLPYGDRIDYTKDFALWVENKGGIPATYTQTEVDMGLSSAKSTGWTGTGSADSEYEFTVVRGGATGESIWVADGENLSLVQVAESMEAALAQGIRSQTLTITDANGNVQTLEIGQAEGLIPPTAAAISEALSSVDGLQATAQPNQMELDISELLPGTGGMQEHDEVRFTLSSGGIEEEVVFLVGSDAAATQKNFKDALDAVVDQSSDLELVSDPAAPNLFVLKSAKGENLGIGDFRVVDNARITLDNFVADQTAATPPLPGSASFTLAGVPITFSLGLTGGAPADVAKNLEAALNRQKDTLKAQGISWKMNAAGTGVDIWGSEGKALDIKDLATNGANNTGGFTVTGNLGTEVGGVATPVALTGAGTSSVTIGAENLATGTLGADGTDLVTGGADSAVKTSTFTIFAAPGMKITTDAERGFGSLFDVEADMPVPSGNSVLTLGGDGGFDGFDAGDTISFLIDGVPVSYTVDAAHTEDEDLAQGLSDALHAAGLDPRLYHITEAGSSVSILRRDADPIRMSAFDSTGGDAKLDVVTGNGIGLEGPSTVVLESTAAGSVSDSKLTLGGAGGFSGFNAGDTISFNIDGVPVRYVVDPTHTEEADFAQGLSDALNDAGLPSPPYTIGLDTNTNSVSITKTTGDIRMSAFDDTTGDAKLRVEGGTTGNVVTLESEATQSAVFGAGAAVEWRKLDADGHYTGISGRIDVEDSGPYTVEMGLSFEFSPGSLVAGNTFSVNTDETGKVSQLDMEVRGRAGSVNDSYVFSVKPPGGALGEETVTLMWENRYGHGEVEVEVDSRTKPPITVEVDGMKLAFESGTLFSDDIFIVETDSLGNGTVMRESDWHWTTDSFSDEFNRQSDGVTAKVLIDGSLSFTTETPSFEISDVGCSGMNGFCDVNTEITVIDATALTEEVLDFKLERDAAGNWSILNDDPYGVAQLVPPGGNDSGFGIDLTGDGLADIALNFDKPVTGSGNVEFDILKRNPDDYGFVFSGEDVHDSGLAAALGVNTFYVGTDAATMEVNERLKDTETINAGRVDSLTGALTEDNTLARDLSDLQDVNIDFEDWHFSRNGKAMSTQTDASLEGYYQGIVSSLGVRYQTEERSLTFYATMLSNLGQQRDSLSAVSLDEEMVNLIKYQQAFTAAAKLITVSDEMLSTLVNMR